MECEFVVSRLIKHTVLLWVNDYWIKRFPCFSLLFVEDIGHVGFLSCLHLGQLTIPSTLQRREEGVFGWRVDELGQGRRREKFWEEEES